MSKQRKEPNDPEGTHRVTLVIPRQPPFLINPPGYLEKFWAKRRAEDAAQQRGKNQEQELEEVTVYIPTRHPHFMRNSVKTAKAARNGEGIEITL